MKQSDEGLENKNLEFADNSLRNLLKAFNKCKVPSPTLSKDADNKIIFFFHIVPNSRVFWSFIT